MATLAQSSPDSQRPSRWFWQFLKQELAPYPSRAEIVTRLAIAATLTMIVCMTFRISFAAYGALVALMVSRESARSTLESVASLLFATGISVAYVLVSAWFVINDPLIHLLWFIGSMFLAFYVISIFANYAVATVFAYMFTGAAPLWDRHVSAETNVKDTLRLALAVVIGLLISAEIELAIARLQPGDEVVLHISERLSAVETLLIRYADGRAVDPAIEKKINRLQTVGTSMLRRILRRSSYSIQYSATMAGVAVLAGRLVDLAAALIQFKFEPSASDRGRSGKLALTLARIRKDLINREIPGALQPEPEQGTALSVPLLSEMKHTAALIPRVFAVPGLVHQHLPLPDDVQRPALFAQDALTNPEHLRFALKGGLAASICYVIYNAIAWPGISTCVTTCLVTALTTIGASRQKQILRIAGAIAGGFFLGIGSQIFILPYLDSIGGLVVLFGVVTALAAWFMTASPRLSYFGVQAALAFYFVTLQDFAISTSLSAARDRVVGILFGLFVMWIVFDRLWGGHAAAQMKRTFISNLRLVAQFAREPLSTDLKAATKRHLTLRETINANFDTVRALADGVLFEFGPTREQDLALRSRIRQWETELRMIFTTRTVLWKYRMRLPGFELPGTVGIHQREYDERSARVLEEMAHAIEGRSIGMKVTAPDSSQLLQRVLDACRTEDSEGLAAGRVESFVALLRGIDDLTASFAKEIAAEPGAVPIR